MDGEERTQIRGPSIESASPLPAEFVRDPGCPAAAALHARSWAVRVPAAALFLSCAALLAVSVWLKPDPHGMGTHQQLGLQPCGMLIMTGYPCPTCGMTTAYAHTVRGHLVSAVHAQVSGFILALATAAVAAGSLFALVRGCWPRVPWHVVTPYRLMLALLILTLGGWFVKIAVGWIDGSIPVPVADRRW